MAHRDFDGESIQNMHALRIEPVILLIVFACYLVAARIIFTQDENVVPTGDAFTYTISLFQILNVSHAHWLDGISYVADNGMIWLQQLSVWLLSPFLFNERASLIVVNFVAFATTAIIIYRSALSLHVHPIFSFLLVVVFMLMPWNFDGRVPFNLTSLMPEPLFMYSLLWAAFALCHFASTLDSHRKAVYAGIASAAFVLSRGNALPYLAFGAAAPIAFVATRRFWFRRPLPQRALLNIFVALLLAIGISAIYFYFTVNSILHYYLVHAQTVYTDESLRIWGALWILLNIPGIFIAGEGFGPHTGEVSYIYYSLTAIAHVIVIVAFVRALRQVVRLRGEVGFEVILGMTGFALFYGVLLFSAFTFSGLYSDPLLRVTHPFASVVLAVVISGFMLACQRLNRVQLPRLGRSFALVLAASSLAVVVSASRFLAVSMPVNAGPATGQTAPLSILPRPGDLREFSETLDRATLDAPIAFFWYGLFNAQIVDYYLAQRGMPMLNFASQHSLDTYVWGASLTPELLVPKPEFEEYMQHVIGEAEYLVVPETMAMLELVWSCPITHYRNEIARYLDTPSLSPDYVVWAVVREPAGRVIVLRRYHTNEGLEEYERFPRDWGTPGQVVGRAFRNAKYVVGSLPLRYATQPRLLRSYGAYNIVEYHDLIYAVPQAAGKLGPDDYASGRVANLPGTIIGPTVEAVLDQLRASATKN